MKPAQRVVPVLVVAQTPPPIHGQALMGRYLLEGNYASLRLHHVRMSFSNDLQEVGSFQIAKVFHLAALIVRMIAAKFLTGAKVLYYPPAGPNLVPFLRDGVLLAATRWLFPKTVFHFHANGLSTLYPHLSFPLRLLFRLAYHRPDLSIRVSPSGPDDAAFIGSKQTAIVPNCIPDTASQIEDLKVKKGAPPLILYMGTLFEDKGVLVLLEACALLKKRGLSFQCKLAGREESRAFASRLEETLDRLDLRAEVDACGQVTGDSKWTLFQEASLFCFPSFYTSEGCPLVILEAFQYGLPVVSTHWRGIPDLVEEGVTGFLVPIRDAEAVADRLERLLNDPTLRETMGRRAREHYEQEFRIEIFQQRMESLLLSVAEDGNAAARD